MPEVPLPASLLPRVETLDSNDLGLVLLALMERDDAESVSVVSKYARLQRRPVLVNESGLWLRNPLRLRGVTISPALVDTLVNDWLERGKPPLRSDQSGWFRWLLRIAPGAVLANSRIDCLTISSLFDWYGIRVYSPAEARALGKGLGDRCDNAASDPAFVADMMSLHLGRDTLVRVRPQMVDGLFARRNELPLATQIEIAADVGQSRPESVWRQVVHDCVMRSKPENENDARTLAKLVRNLPAAFRSEVEPLLDQLVSANLPEGLQWLLPDVLVRERGAQGYVELFRLACATRNEGLATRFSQTLASAWSPGVSLLLEQVTTCAQPRVRTLLEAMRVRDPSGLLRLLRPEVDPGGSEMRDLAATWLAAGRQAEVLDWLGSPRALERWIGVRAAVLRQDRHELAARLAQSLSTQDAISSFVGSSSMLLLAASERAATVGSSALEDARAGRHSAAYLKAAAASWLRSWTARSRWVSYGDYSSSLREDYVVGSPGDLECRIEMSVLDGVPDHAVGILKTLGRRYPDLALRLWNDPALAVLHEYPSLQVEAKQWEEWAKVGAGVTP